jgi:hypothetical protein
VKKKEGKEKKPNKGINAEGRRDAEEKEQKMAA